MNQFITVTSLQIHCRWRHDKMTTAEIAEEFMVDEADIYNALSRTREHIHQTGLVPMFKFTFAFQPPNHKEKCT